MYSQIYKGQVVPNDEDSLHVIDMNARMEEIFEAQREEFEKKNNEKRDRLVEEYVETLELDEEGFPIIPKDDDGEYIIPNDPNGVPLLFVHSDGSLAQYPEEERDDEGEEPPEGDEAIGEGENEAEESEPEPEVDIEAILEEANRQADGIVAEARLRAKETLDQANMQAEAMKTQAIEDGTKQGRKEGYDEGFQKGHDEARHDYDDKKQECEQQVAAADQKVCDMQAEVEAMKAEVDKAMADVAAREENMEERLVGVICDVIDKMFNIEFSDKRDIVLHIVDHVITNNPGSKEYLIRVNEENFPRIDEKRAELKEKVGAGVELDIIKDPLLTNDQCMIETDGGVFDCGMDVQLKNLLNDLRALSLA